EALRQEVAARLQLSDKEVAERDERPTGFLEQLLTALAGAEMASGGEVAAWSPPYATGIDARQAIVRLTEDLIREAARGNAVVVGRGAAHILGPGPDSLHVFLHAPAEWRVASLRPTLGVPDDQIRRRIDEVDANRGAYVKQVYNQ